MSLTRLNNIVMSGIVPFNFGMTADDWQKLYEQYGADSFLIGGMSEPATWSEDEKARVNAKAARERAIVDELMAIDDWDAFDQRVDYYLSQQET